MKADIIHRGAEELNETLADLPQDVYLLPLRLALIFAVVGLVCWVSFRRGSRSTALQVSLACIAIAITSIIPLEAAIPKRQLPRAWLFLAASALALALPRFIFFPVFRRAGVQAIAKRLCYYSIALCLLLTFLIRK